MEALWSMSTTIREAERIIGFLKTATKLNGKSWNSETQCEFQIRLIQDRQYLNDPDSTQALSRLTEKQKEALTKKDKAMSYEMAKSIFDTKKYNDPPMRGRQSMSPLVKLGLVYYQEERGSKIVKITDSGKKLANGEIQFNDYMLDTLLKYQYPNPQESGFRKENGWNTKPFINTLRLIREVNKKCEKKGISPKGISTLEFGIFALSLKAYTDIDNVADKILDFRENLHNKKPEEKSVYTKQYILEYLKDFNNPVQNCHEYTDNMIRYLRLTNYIYIRGKYENTYIDLEPRRKTEIDSILANDKGEAIEYTKEDWIKYIGTYGTYPLPFKTISALTDIAKQIIEENNRIEQKIGLPASKYVIPGSIDELTDFITAERTHRTELQNLEIRYDYQNSPEKIEEAKLALRDIRIHNKANLTKKYSIELEKWANVVLNILDDAVLIKPNTTVGDDNEPTYTAPAGKPDIECYYKNFDAICEVTTLCSRDQWYNEGQPVMRHLREFESSKDTKKPSYCLFIAPKLHTDTINTFYTSVKYEYDGTPQKIIPITILQFEKILSAVSTCLTKQVKFSHAYLQNLFELCTKDIKNIRNTDEWLVQIDNSINAWAKAPNTCC